MIRRSVLAAVLVTCCTLPVVAQEVNTDIFDRDNLVAWCIVPFDAKNRGPEARAEMLTRMGITKLAYDWRAEHIPTFDEELQTLKRYGIDLTAFWFPGALNDEAQAILDALKRNDVQTELWVSMHGGDLTATADEQARRVQEHAAALKPIAEAAAAQGCKVGLYNHGGWFGEPRNQIAIIHALNALGISNVGIAYNLHHGHTHVDGFAELLDDMVPYLYCLNLNGMEPDGDQIGKKILPLGTGSLDLELLRIIAESGYEGPIGILDHVPELDSELILLDNIEGLEWLVEHLHGSPPDEPRPPLRTHETQAARAAPNIEDLALDGGIVVKGNPAYSAPPITVECRVNLDSADQFNILVANQTKASGRHWEIFTEHGTGRLAVYAPGLNPDHVRTDRVVTDGQWRDIAMHYGTSRIALYVDGEKVADQAYTKTDMPAADSGFAIGRLVEGGFFCLGEIGEVRLSKGLREIVKRDGPLKEDADTIALWSFDEQKPTSADETARLPPVVEDAARRAAMPEFQIIPAAKSDSLTPAIDTPPAYFNTWQRSHGDPHNTRYSSASQITRENVLQLRKVWEYRSGDAPANVQCNPILVDGLLIAPTSGEHLVGIDAASGEERWRFKARGRPAHRGLTYWPGDAEHEPRILFPAGDHFIALNPTTGKPVAGFGKGGRIQTGPSVVAPAVYDNVVVIPGFERDVWGYDVRTGRHLWTFNTIPADGEIGRDTWSEPSQGANCWGGMAMDEQRGIAYISTGSPKPNFAGSNHTGQNLFSNSVIALDAKTGQRLWHFQEVRHDIWDMDIPAPPNLVTLDWNGRRIDAVAQVTKLGNTLLLDRMTGEPLFPFRLRRAPVSKLPGERTWPYQPDLELPEPFAKAAFTLDDVTDRTRDARLHVMNTVAGANMGRFEPFEENKPTALFGIHGGAEWTGAAFDPTTGKLYVSANHIPWLITVFRPDPTVHDSAHPTKGRLVYETNCMQCHGAERFGVGMAPPLHGLANRFDDDQARRLLRDGRNNMPALPDEVCEEDLDALLDYLFLRDAPQSTGKSNPRAPLIYTHNGYPKLLDDEGYPGSKPPWGTLNCIDLASGKIVWRVPLGVYPELAVWGEDDTGAENFGGPTVTAGGLVFCAGTPDNLIRAFDATTGEVLWRHELPYGGYAPPTVYEIDGKQHVVIAATGGGKLDTKKGDAYIAFALP